MKKGLLFCVMSYLLARLELAVHISKTALERFKPSAQIEYLSRFDSSNAAGQWIFTESQDYFLNIDPKERKLILYEFPLKSIN